MNCRSCQAWAARPFCSECWAVLPDACRASVRAAIRSGCRTIESHRAIEIAADIAEANRKLDDNVATIADRLKNQNQKTTPPARRKKPAGIPVS